MTFKPRWCAVWAYSTMREGVRCAETIATEQATLNSSQTEIASDMVGKSESLPMIIPTVGSFMQFSDVRFQINGNFKL
jgi:spore germination protein GerM